MEKFNQLSVSVQGYELCFYWLDSNGIETLLSLYNWLEQDHTNRRLFIVSDELEAGTIVKNRKKLKAYIG
jgi:hypothetical protein